MKKTRYYDRMAALGNIPTLMGLQMRWNGHTNIWEGMYYIDGSRHAYKSDKLKVKLWKGEIWVFEQGGQALTLPNWLIQYGGAKDWRDAYRMIEFGARPNLQFVHQNIVRDSEVVYVPKSVWEEYKQYPLENCNLFCWMCRQFGEERVREVWERYMVTTDERGLVVWWYVDAEGRICYDKRMRYLNDGTRDKQFGGTRRYKTADGFTARPLFGSHLLKKGSKLNTDGILSVGGIGSTTDRPKVVESEKTSLLAVLAYSGTWLACGGKNTLRGSEGRSEYADLDLYPDMDAIAEWSNKGNVVEWWHEAEELGIEIGEKWDIGDLIIQKNKLEKQKQKQKL